MGARRGLPRVKRLALSSLIGTLRSGRHGQTAEYPVKPVKQ